MFSVRAAFQLILVLYCWVALPAHCGAYKVVDRGSYKIIKDSEYSPFMFPIRDDKGKLLCHGAYVDDAFILTPADCFKDINYRKVVVLSQPEDEDEYESDNSGETKNKLQVKEVFVAHQIGILKQIENLNVALLRVTENVDNFNATLSTPLCENGQLCGVVTSCSDCSHIGYSKSFLDYDYVRDLLKNEMKSIEADYRTLQLNVATQNAEAESQTAQNIYYYDYLDINYANYLVRLFANDKFLCAGARISNEYVVTAAECFDDIDHTKVELFMGSSILDSRTSASRNMKIIIHPAYNSETKNSNVAVLKLEHEFATGDFGESWLGSLPLCDKPLKENTYVKVTGWRHMAQMPTTNLHSTIVPLMSKEKCYNNFDAIAEHGIFCTEGNNFDNQFGVADLGSAAIYNGQVCGLAASCSKCGDIDYSNSFVDLYYFRDFIKGAMV